MLRIALAALLIALSLADREPQYPPEGRYPLDRFHLVKPYTRWISKYHTLGAVMTTMSEIRLTPDAKSSNGAIWSREKIGLDAFTVEARLRISARSTSLTADGMGIWFNERTSLGNAYGIGPMFTGFGVVLDIYDNTHSRRAPFIQLVASNGTKVFNNDNNGEAHSLDSCRLYDAPSLVREGYDHNARESIAIHVEYLPGKMGIYYKLENDLDWRHCLTYDNIFIPNYFYLGVSASTGDLTAQQDLVSLKVFDLPIDLTMKARSTMHFEQTGVEGAGGKTPTEGGKILSVLFFTLAFFVVLGGIAVIVKPDLLPGSSASIDKQKRFY